MKKYAMLLNNIVIDIVYSDANPVYPPTQNGCKITSIEIDGFTDSIIEIGMTYIPETNEFIFIGKEPDPTPNPPEPTQLDNIENGVNQLLEGQSAMDVFLGVDEQNTPSEKPQTETGVETNEQKSDSGTV